MLDLVFLIAAIIGCTVMVCQFLLTLMGMTDHGGDLTDGTVAGHDFGGHPDFSGHGDFAADADLPDDGLLADSHTGLAHVSGAEHQHADSSWLFGVLSFRTLIAAAAFFGVAGKTALSAGYSQGISLALAVVVGLAAMYGMYWLLLGLTKLASSGNEQISRAVGCHATVYVPIPADGAGVGKVHVTLQNRTVEYQAVSRENETLKTGETVEIVEVTNSDTVSVQRA